MICRTPNCEREVRFEGHVYCDECFPVVWRTGRPPELAPRAGAAAPAPEPFVPEWRRRLTAKDMTGTVAA